MKPQDLFDDDDFEREFDSMLDPAHAGLLVVDIQEKLFPFIHEKEEVLRRSLQMIQIAGHLKMPILVTEQYVKGLGPTVPEVKGLLESLGAYKPIEKMAFSCFGEEDFGDAFDASEIETLAVVGIEAHVCVMQTALDAIDRGVDLFVASEAVGSRDPGHKAEARRRMRDAGAIVGSTEMFAFEMMRTSAHPAFKQVQKVIL